MGLALLIYLGMHWYNVWDIIPEKQKPWVILALWMIALSSPTEKVIYREKS